jgi:two-component system response regulator ResD
VAHPVGYNHHVNDPIHILVVDDDPGIRNLTAAYLEKEGYAVSTAADGHAALREVEKGGVDLIILDVMMPGRSGLQVARKVAPSHDVPILMMTALGEEEDVLRGFEAGADDYLTKPFSPKVLVARVAAILRRSGRLSTDDAHSRREFPGLSVDLRSRDALVDGASADLTTTEFDLLAVLSEHPGWVYSREQLFERVWGYEFLGDSRVVDVHIANLRAKLGEDSSRPRFIRTVRGAGYKFLPSDEDHPGGRDMRPPEEPKADAE